MRWKFKTEPLNSYQAAVKNVAPRSLTDPGASNTFSAFYKLRFSAVRIR